MYSRIALRAVTLVLLSSNAFYFSFLSRKKLPRLRSKAHEPKLVFQLSPLLWLIVREFFTCTLLASQT